MKNQLNFIKEQKNNYKISEKNLRKKLNLKEKEINDLRTILNTNISIKSQISSINHDIKDEDNSKEIKEIIPYNDSININKNFYRPKSLTLIERKLSSYNSFINRRNLLQKNITNKSYNSKNLSKHKIKNINKQKNEYKFKTISNIFSGSNSKKTGENKSIKIINNFIKPYCFSNYNSINSIRSKRLNKSDSRSLISRKVITKSKINLPEESIISKILINNNKTDNNSNKDKKENEITNINKNKIMINYNTNIINTNVSIEKLTIRQKMREIRKALDEKISEITRNKKDSVKRTISAIYRKRNKSPFFNEKIKTKRESSLRYHEKKIKSNKLDIKSRKNFNFNRYSNIFNQNFQNFTIQHRNININRKKKIKIKIKNKNNSMFNLKNDTNKHKDKILVIHAYTGKKLGGKIHLYKDKEIKFKKNSSVINLNNKNQTSLKNTNFDNNSRTILNNIHNSLLTYRNNNNFGKINSFKERINKNDIKTKKNFNINNSNNKTSSSLRKYIFNKYISNSKAA